MGAVCRVQRNLVDAAWRTAHWEWAGVEAASRLGGFQGPEEGAEKVVWPASSDLSG